jgi:hypothetical protein
VNSLGDSGAILVLILGKSCLQEYKSNGPTAEDCVTKIVKLDLGERGSIWIEADEVSDEDADEVSDEDADEVSGEKASGRGSIALGADTVATLASAFEQFTQVFEIAQAQLSQLARKAQETSIEIGAKLSTKGNLIIVKGSAEASIKVTMKWSTPKDAPG